MLTEGQAEQFGEDGFLIVRGLLGPAEVGTMKARADLISRGEAGHVDPALLQVEPAVAASEAEARDPLPQRPLPLHRRGA